MTTQTVRHVPPAHLDPVRVGARLDRLAAELAHLRLLTASGTGTLPTTARPAAAGPGGGDLLTLQAVAAVADLRDTLAEIADIADHHGPIARMAAAAVRRLPQPLASHVAAIGVDPDRQIHPATREDD